MPANGIKDALPTLHASQGIILIINPNKLTAAPIRISRWTKLGYLRREVSQSDPESERIPIIDRLISGAQGLTYATE